MCVTTQSKLCDSLCTDVCQHPLLQLLFNVLTLTVKTQLTVSLTFMIVGMVLTAVAVVLLFPLWHMGAFLTGGILALFACEFPLFLLYISFFSVTPFCPSLSSWFLRCHYRDVSGYWQWLCRFLLSQWPPQQRLPVVQLRSGCWSMDDQSNWWSCRHWCLCLQLPEEFKW